LKPTKDKEKIQKRLQKKNKKLQDEFFADVRATYRAAAEKNPTASVEVAFQTVVARRIAHIQIALIEMAREFNDIRLLLNEILKVQKDG
jgi:thymidylate kinase